MFGVKNNGDARANIYLRLFDLKTRSKSKMYDTFVIINNFIPIKPAVVNIPLSKSI